MATNVTNPVPSASVGAGPARIVTLPADPASAAAVAAGNLFVFLCTPAGQKIAADAQAASKAVVDVVKTLAEDVVNVFRGIQL